MAVTNPDPPEPTPIVTQPRSGGGPVNAAPPDVSDSEENLGCCCCCPRKIPSCFGSIPLRACDRPLTRLCVKIAELVTNHYFIWMIVCLQFAVIGGLGLRDITYETDNETLFVPSNAKGLVERAKLEKYFPTNYSAYIPGHETRYLHQVEVMLTSVTRGSVLTPAIWNEAFELNNYIISNLTVAHERERIKYENICARAGSSCVRNSFLNLAPYIESVQKLETKFTYPYMTHPGDMTIVPTPFHLGGLSLADYDNQSRLVIDAKALRLVYSLDCTDEVAKYFAAIWEEGALQFIQSLTPKYIHIDAVNSRSISKELVFNIHDAIPYIQYAVGAVLFYTTANMYHPTKPSKIKLWMGLIGLLNTLVATIAAWGFLSYFKWPWQAINLASVFLLLGVGLDDTFVMLSAWNHTNEKHSLMERMVETYKEAAVSITITSLTNILSFVVGAFWPGYMCVQIFCFYTGLGITFVYVYNLFFFGSFLAFFGKLEEDGKHGVLLFYPCKKDQTPANAEEDRGCETDEGIAEDVVREVEEEKKPYMISSIVFSTVLPNLLSKKFSKIFVILLFVIYVVACSFWLSQTREGFERRKMARDQSTVVSYYDLEDSFFRTNPYRIQVAILDPLDYSKKEVRESVHALMNKFKESQYIASYPGFEENWLVHFENSVATAARVLDKDIDSLYDEENFWNQMAEFVRFASDTPLKHNLVFSEDKKSILASRIFLQSSRVKDSKEEMAMIKELRDIAASANFTTVVFNPYFPFIDLYLNVFDSVLACLTIGTAIMGAIAVLLIPNCSTSFWVIITIVSIEVGVLGFMFLWNINLDVISMICLIMCIGFSVDFSAHISYHFMASHCRTADERLKESLTAFGTPVIQGGVSTILAVVVFAGLPSYILQSFAKMLFLVITLGVLHGLLLLPVLLSLFTELMQTKGMRKICGILKKYFTFKCGKPEEENNQEQEEMTEM